MKPLKFFILGMALLVCRSSEAGKFNFNMGYYSLSAISSTAKRGNVNNFGIYNLEYRLGVLSHFEIGLGYSILMSNIIGGDLGYGPDFSLYWYPLTLTTADRGSSDKVQYASTDLWKPYLGISFSQRQFQAVQTNYAGFGLMVGLERVLTDVWSVQGLVNFHSYSGNASSSATEFDYLGGISFLF